VSVEGRVANALAAFEAGRIDDASAICRDILAEHPDHARTRHLAGLIATRRGEGGSAVAELRQAVAAAPEIAAIHYDLAKAHRLVADWSAAADAFGEAARLDPANTGALLNQAIDLQRAGRGSEAIAGYRRVLGLKPDSIAACLNLAQALLDAGDLAAARDMGERATALAPEAAHSHKLLGTILMAEGDPERALSCFTRAGDLAPQDPEAAAGLGHALQKLGRFAEAEAAYRRLVALVPDRAEGHNNLAMVLAERGQFAAARGAFEAALARDPDNAAIHLNLGNLLLQHGRPDSAIRCFEHATAIAPASGEAWFALGSALQDQGRNGAARDAFRKAVAADGGDLRARWASLLSLPVIYQSEAEISGHRARWVAGLEELHGALALDSAEGRGRAIQAMTTLTDFYLPYQGGDVRGPQERFGALLGRIAAAAYPHHTQALAPSRAAGRIRVGFLSSHWRHHSIGKLFGGWISHLDRDRFETVMFSTGRGGDSVTEALAAHADQFHDSLRAADRLVRCVADAKLDALIYPDIGMDPIVQLPAALRLAPVQCVAWGHPVTTGLATMDYFLTSAMMEPADGEDHYTETLVRLPNLSIAFPVPAPAAAGTLARDPDADNADVVYFCAQSFYKLLPQFDPLYPRIAARVPAARFWFIAHKSDHTTQVFRARLERAFAAYELDAWAYCTIRPQVDQQGFYDLNRQADLGLDSILWSGGVTTLEAIGRGLPVITCPGPTMRSCHGAAIMRMIGVEQTIARDFDHMIAIAVELGRNAALRRELRAKVRRQGPHAFDDRTPIRALEDFLERACRQSGPAPRPE
jgi:predicted O-linked N-acetylglucosamine transferase (SPINDLY family)